MIINDEITSTNFLEISYGASGIDWILQLQL